MDRRENLRRSAAALRGKMRGRAYLHVQSQGLQAVGTVRSARENIAHHEQCKSYCTRAAPNPSPVNPVTCRRRHRRGFDSRLMTFTPAGRRSCRYLTPAYAPWNHFHRGPKGGFRNQVRTLTLAPDVSDALHYSLMLGIHCVGSKRWVRSTSRVLDRLAGGRIEQQRPSRGTLS